MSRWHNVEKKSFDSQTWPGCHNWSIMHHSKCWSHNVKTMPTCPSCCQCFIQNSTQHIVNSECKGSLEKLSGKIAESKITTFVKFHHATSCNANVAS